MFLIELLLVIVVNRRPRGVRNRRHRRMQRKTRPLCTSTLRQFLPSNVRQDKAHGNPENPGHVA